MKFVRYLFILFAVFPVQAAVKTQAVTYEDGKDAFEGYLAYDDSLSGPRPGVIVVHEWMGLGDHVKKNAEKLAALGYIAFGADIYGEGVRPKTLSEAGEEASKYKNDRDLFRKRMNLALKQIKKFKRVDPKKIAAIGYCFGGTGVLELARSGAELAGVVSFHGGLDSPRPEDAKQIKTKVLVLAGADDPYVPIEQVRAFEREMSAANVDWQLIRYAGAVHSFTNPQAGNDPSKGAAYDERADRRSWEHMKLFFNEIFH